jgi:hypothetical protein
MSIRKAIGWLFDVGDGREGEAAKAARAREVRRDEGPDDAGGVQLYGEAEAIRVLYQTGLTEGRRAKPPGPKRGRGVWVARYLNSLVPSLRDPAGAKA